MPQDGTYTLEIRDALYRGRQDFIYRVAIGDPALLQAQFPNGSRVGASIGPLSADWSSPAKLDLSQLGAVVSQLPRCTATASGSAKPSAQTITLPQLIDGCISHPGDTQVFRFAGHAGDTVVAEVYARRLGSPLDSLLRLRDSAGHVLAWNDDYEDPRAGLLTHQADSYLSFRLPGDGAYSVQVSDAQGHGGDDYHYYLRIGPPQADFALCLVPSAINVPAGHTVPISVTAIRQDGWNGDIEVGLVDAPAGFTLSGTRIPAGQKQVRMTLTAPARPTAQPIELHMEGRAQIGGQMVSRPVIPAEQMMQAFAYLHLVPAQHLLAMVTRAGRNAPNLALANGEPLRIPAGGHMGADISLRSRFNIPVHLELSDPPAGVTLQQVTATPGGFTLELAADEKHIGYADNLIIDAYTETEVKNKAGAVTHTQRIYLGTLPAIPFEIVKP